MSELLFRSGEPKLFYDRDDVIGRSPTAPRANVLKVVNREQTVPRWLAESRAATFTYASVTELVSHSSTNDHVIWPIIIIIYIILSFITPLKPQPQGGPALFSSSPARLHASVVTVCGPPSCLCPKLTSSWPTKRNWLLMNELSEY